MKEYIHNWDTSKVYNTEGERILYAGTVYELRWVRDKQNLSKKSLCFVPLKINMEAE